MYADVAQEDDPFFYVGRSSLPRLCDTCGGCSVDTDAGVLILHRATPGTRTTFTDPVSGNDLFDAASLKFRFETGPRIS